ncbi:MAG: HEAT repeat domain-containing protein [Myxococcales bacterium]|nr:HEAT repeat domain-containing protein [Myxococcales bacterium]
MRRTTVIAAASAVLLAATAANAQRRPPGRTPPAQGAQNAQAQDMSLREAREAIQSSDVERIVDGLEAIVTYPSAEVVQLVVELIRRGNSDRVTDTAIETLGQLARPEAIDELSTLLRHRRVAARAEAVESLAKIQDPRVRGLIESALHDSAPEVRAAAAVALGTIGNRQSVTLLFRAFERGVPEAAAAIGRIGSADDAVSGDAAHDSEDPRRTSRRQTLSMWITHASISVLLSGFEQFLNRRDVPSAVKIKIIERLEQRAASAAVRDFLQRWVNARPASARNAPEVTRANLAIRQIQGGSR